MGKAVRLDGEATRARILAAAGELFASTGYAETTNKAIASRAQVDLASINYHFGSRSGLYQAVLIEAHRQLVDYADLHRLAESQRAPSEKLHFLIEQVVVRAMAEPQGWYLQVLARELLSPSSQLQLAFKDALQPKFEEILRILSEITAIPKGEPALARCAISVVGPCLMLIVGRQRVPGPLHDVVHMPHEVVVSHLHRFALAGLEAIAADYRQPSA